MTIATDEENKACLYCGVVEKKSIDFNRVLLVNQIRNKAHKIID